MILAGRVTVGGVPAKLGQSAQFGVDDIAVDGVPLAPKDSFVYIMLNKPRGYVTTVSDERGRKTVMSIVKDVGVRVFPIGRLDINSEGLLLMTNDGEFANGVAHPSFSKAKTYEVRVGGDAKEAAAMLRRPLDIDSHTVHAKSVSLLKTTDTGGVLRISIYEGRNKQIRKMCAQCGLEVLSLKRVSIGSVSLGTLKTGRWRHLTRAEVDLLSNES